MNCVDLRHFELVKRRHLTDDQRACLAQEEMQLLSAESRRERAIAGGKAGGRGRCKSDSSPITTNGKLSVKNRDRESRSVVSARYQVSHRKVQTARRLQRESPRLYRRVRSGELRLSEAKREAQRDAKRKQQDQLAKKLSRAATDTSWQIICGDCIEEMRQMK